MNLNNPNLLLVVVPAFNEEASIGAIVKDIKQVGLDVLVVNDGSADKTSQLAKLAGAIVMDLPINLGVGGALRSGFKFAVSRGYTAVLQIDGDGQHPVHQIQQLIAEYDRTKADMVIGSRFATENRSMKVHFARNLMMKVLARNASRATGTKLTDVTSGFRIIGGKLLIEFSLSFPVNYLGDTYEAVMSAGKGGYKVIEIPADITDREFGESSASTFQALSFTIKTLLVVVLRIHSPIAKK
jgi:glycosyltransferase involved in cell wall biosynthesis